MGGMDGGEVGGVDGRYIDDDGTIPPEAQPIINSITIQE